MVKRMDCPDEGKGSEDESDDNPDDYFEWKLYSISAIPRSSFGLLSRIYLCEGKYINDGRVLGRYLENLEWSEGLSDVDYQKLRKKSRNFLVRDGYLFKHSQKRRLRPRRVISLRDQRLAIIQELHDGIGHRGK